MKENRILSNLGKVLLTFLIALSSIGMPTTVSANSEYGSPYAYAKADELAYINETGLSLEELKGIDVYEVTGNMQIKETTWGTLDNSNGEYILRLRDHNPDDSIYPLFDSRLKSRRVRSQAVYAYRLDPLLKHQPCVIPHKMIEQLGLVDGEQPGRPGFTIPGNLQGVAGPDVSAATTNAHTYLMMDPRVDSGEFTLNVDLRVTYDTTNEAHKRFNDIEFKGFKDNLMLYVNYIDSNGEIQKELVSEDNYKLSFTKAEDLEGFHRATFEIPNDKYIEGSIISYEPVLAFEGKSFHSVSHGNKRINNSFVEMKASYSFDSKVTWSREANLDSYKIQGTPIDEYVKEHDLSSHVIDSDICGAKGETNIENVSKPGKGYMPSTPPPSTHRRTLKKYSVGQTDAIKTDSLIHNKKFSIGLNYDDYLTEYSTPLIGQWEKLSDLVSLYEDEFYIYNDYDFTEIVEKIADRTNGTNKYETTDAVSVIVVEDAQFDILKSDEPGRIKLDRRKLSNDNLLYNDALHVFNIEQKEFSVDKTWEGKELDEATFVLKADGEIVDELTLTKEDGWSGSFGLHPVYTVDEKSFNYMTIRNDEIQFREIEYTVEEVNAEGYEATVVDNGDGSFSITNKEVILQKPLIPAKTKVSVEKQWELFQKEAQPVTVNLLADGKKVDSVKLSKDNNWKHTFTDLNVVNDVKDEKAIVYTVEEVSLDGFEVTIEGNQKDGFVITNKEIVPQTPLVPATTEVKVEKQWELYEKETQPVTVNLLADGKKVDSVVLSDENNWKHTFTDLKVVNDVKDEKAIVYTVEEVEVDGFESVIEGNQKDGFMITNKEIIPQTPLVPATTKIKVEKKWRLFAKESQPVTVNLLADGNKVDSVELSAKNDWEHTFADLKVVNDVKDEKAIVYTVEEVEIEGFESTIEGSQADGFVIMNKEITPQKPLIPAKTSVSVSKQWSLYKKDKQPVTVNLLADGTIVDSVELSDDNNWTHTFADLKVVNDVKDDKAIVYTVEEVEVDGFEAIIEGNQKEGFVITNKEIVPQTPLVPAKTSVSVKKQWELFQLKKQPVTVNLLADGDVIDSVVLSKDNKWSHTFTDLKVVNDVKDEKAIEYTVEEVRIDEFESIIEGNQNDGFIITNKEIVPQFPLTPGTTSITVNKEWNLFQKDKEPVTIELLANGDVVDSIELSDDNEWTHTFSNLKVVNEVTDEKAIEYSVREVEIEGFESEVKRDGNSFAVINTEIAPQFPLTPGKTSVTVVKQWELMRLEKQPVVIELLADGEVVDEVTLSDDNEWTHTFADLNVVNDVADEKAIEYSVREVTPEGFLSIIEKGENGEIIVTNSEIPVPNITADKTVDKAEIKPGEIVEYTITVTNDGTGNKFVKVKDPMDDLIDYVTFVDEYVMVGDIPYTFSELRNGIEFEIGVGQTVEITFKVQFNEDAEGEFLNVAFVDELEPEVPVTVIPEEPNCGEPQDPNNPDPNCPIIPEEAPEEPNCDEPQDPNNPDPNCPIIPEEPQVDVPSQPGRPVDTGELRRPPFVSFALIGLSTLYVLKKRKQ